MKNHSFFLLLLLDLFFASSTFAQADNLSVIELSLNVDEFKKYLAKDEMNKNTPLIVVTNRHFSKYLELDFEGKRVDVFTNKKEANLEEDQVFLEVKKFKIRDDAAILKFKYNGYTIRIKHKKIDGVWTFNTFGLKGNKKRYIYSVPVN